MSVYRYCDRCGEGIESDTPKEYYKWDKLRRVAPKVYAAIDEFFSEEVIRDKKVNQTMDDWLDRIDKLESTLLMSISEIGRMATKLSETMSCIPDDTSRVNLFTYNTACNTLDSAKELIEHIKSCDFIYARTGAPLNDDIRLELYAEWPTPTRRTK